jgi:septum site-determining protein MinD
MAQIISIHSYRGGTGKSNITANLAWTLYKKGNRVAVVDTDIQSPGIHIIFNIGHDENRLTLNDFLWRKCNIEEAAIKLTPEDNQHSAIFMVPSSTNTGDIARVINDGYNIDLLSQGFEALCDKLSLDYLLIDTHPGLNEETLLSIAISDKLLLVMRPDQQDFEGSSITLKVAGKLGVEGIAVVVNKVPRSIDEKCLISDIEKAYCKPVKALFYHNDEMLLLGSKSIFAQNFPTHEFSLEIDKLSDYLLSDD